MTNLAYVPAERIAQGLRVLPLRRVLTVAMPLAAILAVAAASGGFFATTFAWTGLVFAWVVAAAAALLAPEWGRLERVWAAGAAALCTFTFFSVLWAGSATAAVDAGLRTIVYATAVAGALLLLRRGDLERWLFGLVAGAGAICFYSLATRLFANEFGAFNRDAAYRLFAPVGYSNALGIFAALAALLAFGVAVFGRSATFRIIAAAALVVLLPTLYYTYSRGAWVALVAGLAVAFAICPWRLRFLAGLVVLAPLPALAVWFASRPSALSDRAVPLAASADAGHRVAAEIYALLLAQGLVALYWVVLLAGMEVPRLLQQWAAVGAAVGPLVAIGAALTYYGLPLTFVRHGYDAITGPPAPARGLTGGASKDGLTVLWHAGWKQFEAHPLAGGGAGSFHRFWLAHRGSGLLVQDAHNLYLQTLGELGIVGAALLTLVLGMPLVAARRARSHPLAAAALGAYVAYLVHCVVDWDWQMPAVTLLALFAAAAVVVAARDEEALSWLPAGRTRVVVGALAALAGVLAFVGLVGNIALAHAERALAARQGDVAITQAKKAHRWAPWSAAALRDLGEGELLIGLRQAGLGDLRRAADADPGDWQTWFDIASATGGAKWARAFVRVHRLDPHGPELALLEQAPVGGGGS